MNKILMRVSVLAAAGMLAAPVQAADFAFTASGWSEVGVGFVSGDDGDDNGDTERFDQPIRLVNNAEIHIGGGGTTDSGLTFKLKGELEVNRDGHRFDEVVTSVSGSFGRVEIGTEDGAGDRSVSSGGGCSAFSCAGDEWGLTNDYAGAAAVYTNFKDTGDNFKISYWTPSLSGVQLGVSYVPSLGSESGRNSGDGDEATVNGIASETASGYEFGATYAIDTSRTSVKVGAGYAAGDAETAKNTDGARGTEEWSGYAISLNGKAADVDFGAIFASSEGETVPAGGSKSDWEYTAFNFGIGYGVGPWHVALSYASGEEETNSKTTSEGTEILLGVDYAFAPGVTLGITAEMTEEETPASATADGKAIEKDATGVGLWAGISF